MVGTTLGAILVLCIIISAFSFALTTLDKRRARRGEHRIRERTLLAWAFVGGSPGLLLGMVLTRHKVRKPSFLWRLLFIVGLQLGVVFWFLGR